MQQDVTLTYCFVLFIEISRNKEQQSFIENESI